MIENRTIQGEQVGEQLGGIEIPRPEARQGDPMVVAIDELEQAIAANVADERMLLGKLRALRAARRSGRPWRSIVREEPQPTTLSLTTRLSKRLTSATRAMRHTLALAMLREGATISEVAGHLDVSRQRVSHLVRDRAGRTARPAE